VRSRLVDGAATETGAAAPADDAAADPAAGQVPVEQAAEA
jgi:hypothetical protein